MMEMLVALGLKSMLIAGATLGLLQLSRRRSAADRSWIAHLGLLALVVLPLASLALPIWSVEVPAAFAPDAAPAVPRPTISPDRVDPPLTLTSPAAAEVAPGIDWTPFAYALPALALLLVTLIALVRLFGLRHRAHVLVDPLWLSALAQAQRRMGYKNGTALLTSPELSSPISWGLLRPIILLNDSSLAAKGEAEAIIAHELAHIARFDWAKLILARVATALFWFNPLAWVLAREAHQLREEAADDAVLASNIADTDYAQLLVGIARHECRGLLFGAHGISPGKSSLRRRVGRVLDASLVRGPGGRSWVAGFAVGMLVMAAPLAALTIAPGRPAVAAAPRAPTAPTSPYPSSAPMAPRAYNAAAAPAAPNAPFAPALPKGVRATTVSTATTSVSDAEVARGLREAKRGAQEAERGMREADRGAREAQRGQREADRAQRDADRAARSVPDHPASASLEMRMMGVTPAYVAAIRAAGPQFRGLDEHRMIELRAKHVTPQFIRAIADAGYGSESVEAIGNAAVLGLTAEAVRRYASNCRCRRPLADLAEMQMLGVTPDYIERARRAGHDNLSKDELIALRMTGQRIP